MLNDGEKGVVLQRDRETYGIAPHTPCGVVTPEVLRRIADVAEKYQLPVLKITSAARIALIDKILAYYRDNAKPKERIGRMIERLGLEHMEEALGLGSDA